MTDLTLDIADLPLTIPANKKDTARRCLFYCEKYEPLKISASHKKGRLERSLRAACPEQNKDSLFPERLYREQDSDELQTRLRRGSSKQSKILYLHITPVMYAYRNRRMGRAIDARRFVIARDTMGVHALSVF